MNVKHMHIKIPPEVYGDLQKIKHHSGVNMNEFIVLAIKEQILKVKK